MLQSFSRSIPFFVIRLIVVATEILTLAFGAYYINKVVIGIASNYVQGLFLTLLNPAGWIIGLGVGAFIIKYPFGLLKYYIKIAHIIYVTMITLEYRPNIIRAFHEAFLNFKWLFLSDIATQGIVKALTGFKDAILNNDILKKFKEPSSSVIKFGISICTNGLSNVISMTDEMIVSYTWFTLDMHNKNLAKQGKKPMSTVKSAKTQAKFMLEGMVFVVRTLPVLIVNSIIIEALFLAVANISVLAVVIGFMWVTKFKFIFLIAIIIFHKNLIDLFYYTFVEPMRIIVYIYAFYSEMSKLEPLNIMDEFARLVGKVPVIGGLAKRAGLKVEPEGSEGEPLFETDIGGLVKDNVQTVASAFNLNASDLMEEHADVIKERTLKEELEELDEPLVDPDDYSDIEVESDEKPKAKAEGESKETASEEKDKESENKSDDDILADDIEAELNKSEEEDLFSMGGAPSKPSMRRKPTSLK